MKKFIVCLFLLTFSVSFTQASVTFNLNTSTAAGFTDSTSTLLIRGSFNGWAGSDWQMTNVGGDYWSYTSDTLTDGTYEFKYVMSDGSGDTWESTGNRTITVTGTVDLPLDYWENGTTPPYTATDSVDVWFRISTAGITDYADSTMYIAGTMNGWSGEPLTQEGTSEFWSGQYSFAATGAAVEYKYQNGAGGWESTGNRTANVTSDTTLAFVYFNNQPPTDVTPSSVTFTLNTSTGSGFTDSTSTLLIRGSFNGWAGSDWQMTNVGGDYWTFTSDSLAAGTYEFKYVMVDDAGEHWESTGNRALSVSGPADLPVDFWENGTTPPYTETDSVDVWFRVSTAGIADYAGATMYIAGTMNGWSGEPLTPEGDSTFWSGQYSFAATGDTVEYKFLHGDGGWEGVSNRSAIVTRDTTLAFVYWNNTPPTNLSPVNVTFNLNTSTAAGFTDSTETLVIRGSLNGWAGSDWQMTNVGGDYWTYTTTAPLAIADYEYKYVMIDALGNDNWESTDNRLFSLAGATADVSLPQDYWESGTTPPYTETDSVDVWFRVSTAGIVGYADSTMYIAGTMNGWSGEPLTREGTSEFWSGQYSFAATGAAVEYKFQNGSGGWESIENRSANVTSDTTLAFAYFDNEPPTTVNPVTKTVVFSVDMTEWLDEDGATGMPLFSVSRGDIMEVRGGFNGWNCDTPEDCEMTRVPGTNLFSLAATLTDLPDRDNEYKFYLQHDSSSLALFESEYGPMYGDMGWEDSPQFGGSNRIFQLGEDDGTGLLELPLAGYYDLPAGAVVPVGTDVSLTYSVDMATASDDGFNAAEDSVFLVLKDKWLNYLQGFGDNSKHSATANGDGTYSVTVDFVGPLPWHMIYTWGFHDVSANVDLEEGGGFGLGRFRARYYHANLDRGCAWEDYSFPQDSWQIDPPLPLEEYDPSGVCISLEIISDVIPDKFNLADNYPNPFNPTTNIAFSIPIALDVQINIYNVLGQKVATLNEGLLNAGTYNARWNGQDQMGNTLASGIYFYELQAGNQFRQIKKMTFIK